MQAGKLNGIPAKVFLSNRQYAALRLFTDERSSFVMVTGGGPAKLRQPLPSRLHPVREEPRPFHPHKPGKARQAGV
jgi:hypothetical protein